MKKKNAFTLAEVLITLAIIGVVASLTISSIVVKVKDSKIKAARKVFETKILDTAGVMYAKGELDGTTSANFINKLGHYMKLTKTCDSSHLSDCFPSTIINGDKEISIDNLKTPSSLGQSYTNDNNVGGVMADGTKFILSFSPNCSVSNYSIAVASCMHIIADLPISSNNNTVDEDIYLYNASLKNGYTIEDLNNIGCGAYDASENNNVFACTGLSGNTEFFNALYDMSLKGSDITDDTLWILCSCKDGCYENGVINEDAIVTSCQRGNGAAPPQ